VQSIVENNLYGLDIDDRAAQLAYFAVMMKARQYDRRFFTRNIQPHVCAIQESAKMSEDAWDYFGGEKDIAQRVYMAFADAKEYGSLIEPNVTLEELDKLDARLTEMDNMADYGNLAVQAMMGTVLNVMQPLMKQARILVQKYDVVVTNPPYMGSTGMSDRLMSFTKDFYPDSRADMCTVFMEYTLSICKTNGISSMINTPAWMTMSSFEKMRLKLIDNNTFVSMVHFGRGVFGADFGTTAFAIRRSHTAGYKAVYRKLFYRFGLVDTLEEKENRFHNGMGYHVADSASFKNIPGAPIAYWISPATLQMFSSDKCIGTYGRALQGTISGDNERFLRFWFEVDRSKTASNGQSDSKWYPHNKGGNYRKWYGNREYVINWEDDGKEIRTFVDAKGKLRSRPQNIDSFFIEGISWSDLTAGKYSARFYPSGGTFDATGPTIPFRDGTYLKYLLGNMNTVVFQMLLDISCPGIHYNNGVITKLPITVDEGKKERIDTLVEQCIRLAKVDWDSFEYSWDFDFHPILPKLATGSECVFLDKDGRMGSMTISASKIADCYEAWRKECEIQFKQLKANEEELNRIFIDIYGLQDELTPEVEDKDVTVRKADLGRDIRSLISYAVGCMFGRYSLSKPGLAFAGGEWNASNYTSEFQPDKDGILPISDDDYFTDDIVGRFVRFIEVVYGKETLEENLAFIAKALGGSGTPRDVIRSYFLNDFYADHLKIYQKRPLYWLFDSGKKNGFKALIYMHRYAPDTIARIRTDYVHEQQSRYRTAIADLENRIISASTSERVKLNKQLTKVQAQAEELRLYEEKIHHLADQMISIDLDDGVKVNYAKFADVLAKIK